MLAALSGTALPAAVAHDAVRRARDVPGSLAVESLEEGGAVVTLQLGEPPQGALQLLLAEEPDPSDPLLDRLGTFAVRAAHALRAGERRRTLSVELERTRALLTIVGQAIAAALARAHARHRDRARLGPARRRAARRLPRVRARTARAGRGARA